MNKSSKNLEIVRERERERERESHSKPIKRKQGITLIALVVTIVILLILSGVTINMLLGEDGIIRTAQEAKNTWEGAVANEQQEIQNLANELNSIMNGGGVTGGGDDTPTVPGSWDLSKVTPVLSADETQVYVPVPNGFTSSTVEEEQKVEGGFVIKQDGTNNEFVWIPVNSTQLATMYTEATGTTLSAYEGVDATTDVYSNLRMTGESGIPGSETNREPDILTGTTYGDAATGNSERGIEQIKSVFGFSGTDTEVLDSFAEMLVADYEASYESIKKYGGFYIGRYEITGSVTSPTVQKGSTVLTSQNWYNLYKACNEIVDTTSITSAESTMINGTQWDRVLEWLVETGMPSENVYSDSSTWGNYSNYNTANEYTEGTPGYEETAGTGVQPAGSSEYWKANNIYDLAGNAWDWTQEADNIDYRVFCGGCYVYSGSYIPVSVHSTTSHPSSAIRITSARPALYVK